MKWVVGTGRCGMHNYTALYGGFIQSKEQWKDIGLRRYHNMMVSEDEKAIRSVMVNRMNLPVSFITDCAQFIFIDMIRDIDKSASFVWLQAKKEHVIKGFMEKGSEDKRIHPKGWVFSPNTKKELLSWYYDEVNKIIKEKLQGAKFEHVWMESLPKADESKILALREFA